MATIKDGKGTVCLCAADASAILTKNEIGRPDPSEDDVMISIKYCGMCHSDLHMCMDDWGLHPFPITPGHEIAGIVMKVGSNITNFKIGDRVGVGCFIDSCRTCELCMTGRENYCPQHIQTYGLMYRKGLGHDDCAGYHTNGGYSDQITVRSKFVYHIPDTLELQYVGPLLCAGITMYGPLSKHVLKADSGKKSVGILGFGGLGQVGVAIAKAMGADVTVLSRSLSKRDHAIELGADMIAHTDDDAMAKADMKFDVILDTIAVEHDFARIVKTLKVSGTYVCIGAIATPMNVSPYTLMARNLSIEGSFVGGVPETQEMLDFCGKHSIKPKIKLIHAKDANDQFRTLLTGDADIYRAVIDMSTIYDDF